MCWYAPTNRSRKSISLSTRRNCGTFLPALGTTLASSFQAELLKNTTPNGVMYTKREGVTNAKPISSRVRSLHSKLRHAGEKGNAHAI